MPPPTAADPAFKSHANDAGPPRAETKDPAAQTQVPGGTVPSTRRASVAPEPEEAIREELEQLPQDAQARARRSAAQPRVATKAMSAVRAASSGTLQPRQPKWQPTRGRGR